jgi:hypothetical protein
MPSKSRLDQVPPGKPEPPGSYSEVPYVVSTDTTDNRR